MKYLAVVLLWAMLVGSGFYKLLIYGTTPGESGDPPRFWPRESELPIEQGLNTIVMAVHPHCGCSKTSLNELAIILGKFQNKVRAEVLFYTPSNFDQDWVKTDLWNSAQSIPGVQAIMKAIGSTHQYLSKPCDPQILKATIDRASHLRKLMNNEPLREFISQLEHLPSQADLYDKIISEINAEKPSIEKIGLIIARDIAMTTKILQLVKPLFLVRQKMWPMLMKQWEF